MATKLKKSRIEKKFLIKKKMKFLSLKPSKDGKIIGIRKFWILKIKLKIILRQLSEFLKM